LPETHAAQGGDRVSLKNKIIHPIYRAVGIVV
jgi:hypothetical protein